MSKRSAPLGMTIIIMLFIISIMGVARWSLNVGIENKAEAAQYQSVPIRQTGLNDAEVNVLSKLAVLTKVTNDGMNKTNHTETVYYNFLSEYYMDSDMDLSEASSLKIEKLIRDGDKLLTLENRKQISQMSFDGRKVAIYILKQIYKLNGLKLVMNHDGNIEEITNQSGTVLYENSSREQVDYHIDTLIIILMLLITLLSICIIITKRNQLTEKGGEYNGFNEKGIA